MQYTNEVYSKAATNPTPSLCCPKIYDDGLVEHIPKKLLECRYGCGSPFDYAAVKSGEVVLDLGSGTGVDSFVAAKLVGSTGRVYGVDINIDMLNVARQAIPEVEKQLGYKNVFFVQGSLEHTNLEDSTIDVAVSNCVFNLASDKPTVLKELYRVLKPGGRAIISDIVASEPMPLAMQQDEKLWSDCVSGALDVQSWFSALEIAGFVGVTVLHEEPWQKVAEIDVASLTVSIYKFPKNEECTSCNFGAIYLGPYSEVHDDHGHIYKKFQEVSVCIDTAQMLKKDPYKESFVVYGCDTNVTPKTENCCVAMDTSENSTSSCCEPKASSNTSCCTPSGADAERKTRANCC